MCGIWAAFCKNITTSQCDKCLETLKARGPEGSRSVVLDGVGIVGFTRLAINGLNDAGMQPMEHGTTLSITNGEIYNWKQLAKEYKVQCSTGSDCEIIGKLYELYADKPLDQLAQLFNILDGVFGTVIVDMRKRRIIIARDPYGVRPLFKGITDSSLFVGSELKSLTEMYSNISVFEPGTYAVYDLDSCALVYSARYHFETLTKLPALSDIDNALKAVRVALEVAVKKRMMTERPVAALLSGGLDSSLVASLVSKELRAAGAPPLKTFSIGMEGSEDLFYARKVAKWIGSDHTEIIKTDAEFFEAIPNVIRSIESYDTTTVRASVGNWLVAKAVAEQSDCKVVFNGDGADEIWGSYLYMYNAPSESAYEQETVRLLKDIHTFDVLRSDRSISSHGLEPRTPFLDKAFVQTILQLPVEFRRPTSKVQEKWLLRKAFDDGITLPNEVLYRRKEAFSDGVSGKKPWYLVTQDMSSELFNGLTVDYSKYSINTPRTPEMYYYRELFNRYYGNILGNITVPYFWMPKWSTTLDPSAKTLENYIVL